MKIELIYDKDADINSEEVLGTIKLSSNGNMIQEHFTYLDSWIHGLIQGLEKIQVELIVSVDLIEEPHNLNLKIAEHGLLIAYKEQQIITNSINDFREALLKASTNLISKMNTEQVRRNSFLKDIAAFANYEAKLPDLYS